MGGCPRAWLVHMTGDSTHNFSVRAGGSKNATVITLSWLGYSDKLVKGSSRQFLMSDFSYQKITATASDCSLYWDLAEPRRGWVIAAACSISSVKEYRRSENNVAPFKCLPCWSKSPPEALQLLNALWGRWLCMGNVSLTVCTNKAPLLAQQLLHGNDCPDHLYLPRWPILLCTLLPEPVTLSMGAWEDHQPFFWKTGTALARHKFHAILSIIQ